jgi:AraC family transcriptional regulator
MRGQAALCEGTATTTRMHTAIRPPLRGGLAPWQVRILTVHIDANLNTSLHCETLARLAGFSVSHFSRSFKYTFGFSPHVFLVRRRVERAQVLMLQFAIPLAQIAAECGFSDQAHFSRQFLQCTGESPGSWRRARLTQQVSGGQQLPCNKISELRPHLRYA